MGDRPKLFDAPVVCPFCAIHCDDSAAGLDIADSDVADSPCELQRRSIESLQTASPRIGDQSATESQVIDWAIQSAKHPAIGNPTIRNPAIIAGQMSLAIATDLVRWSIQTGVDLRVQTDPSIAAIQHTIARDGIVTASLGEVGRLADRVLMIGDLFTAYPRIERFLPATGEVTRIGKCDSATIASWMLDTEKICQQSQYFAVIVGPGCLGDSPAEQTVASERLVRWIWDLNQQTTNGKHARRAVLVVIDPASTIADVYRYHRNQSLSPLTTIFNQPTIRIGTPTTTNSSPPVTLQIGGIDEGPSSSHTFLPAAIGGWHQIDATLRGDGVITLPLSKQITSDLKKPVEFLRLLTTRQTSSPSKS